MYHFYTLIIPMYAYIYSVYMNIMYIYVFIYLINLTGDYYVHDAFHFIYSF